MNHGSPVPQDSAANVEIADVLSYYAKERAGSWAEPKRAKAQLAALNKWWGRRRLSEVTAATCRQFCQSRSDTSEPSGEGWPTRAGERPASWTLPQNLIDEARALAEDASPYRSQSESLGMC